MPLPSMTQGIVGRYAPVRQGMQLTQLASDPSMAPAPPMNPVMRPPNMPLPVPMSPTSVAPAPPAQGLASPQMPGSPLPMLRQRFQPNTQGPTGP